MKKLLTILFVLFSLTSYSQTSLDTLIFKKVNEYRKSKGLSELKWGNENLQNGAEHHSNYLYSINLSTVKHVKQLNMSPEDQSIFLDENLVRGHDEEKISSTVPSQPVKQRFEIYGFTRENVTTIFGYMNAGNESFAENIVDSWKQSVTHNATMLHPNLKYAAISTKVFITDVKSSTMVTIENGKKTFHTDTFNNVYIVSTMTFK